MAEARDLQVDVARAYLNFTAFQEATAIWGHIMSLVPDVVAEIRRARKLHGKQHELPFIAKYISRNYYNGMAQSCRNALADPNVEPSWDLILLEEVYEFLEALQAGDTAAAQVEAIQVLAMMHTMLEKLENESAPSRG